VAAAQTTPAGKSPLVQGVFLMEPDSNNKNKFRTTFVPVTTGVTGATDIEVLTGVKEGDEIVTGRYKVLRALKSGTVVKRDNTPETAGDEDKS
jgi:HlyD family secretion protein